MSTEPGDNIRVEEDKLIIPSMRLTPGFAAIKTSRGLSFLKDYMFMGVYVLKNEIQLRIEQ